MSMISAGIRWFFVLLLAASSIGKLADMPGFFAVIKSYALLPQEVIPISAWALAIFELFLAIWMAMGKRIYVAAIFVIALHLVYLAWLVIALARGLDIPNCGCFGVFWARPLTWFTPVEDLILLVLAILMWRSAGRKRAPT
jgi:Methylamine utilisation protein MauE